MKHEWLKRSPRPRAVPPKSPDDTAIRSLSRDERRHISMDAWEPSLLRNLLSAQGRLDKKLK